MSLTFRDALHALLLASTASVAFAQPSPADKASAPSAAAIAPKAAAAVAAPSAAAAASAGASSYRSAFEDYRPLTEQPVLSWRESNDVVGRIGGWQSYAREGQGGAPAGTAEMPATAATQGKSTVPAMPAGHEGMKMPAARPDPASAAAPPKAAAAPAAASAARPGGHTGHKQP